MLLWEQGHEIDVVGEDAGREGGDSVVVEDSASNESVQRKPLVWHQNQERHDIAERGECGWVKGGDAVVPEV